MEGRKILKTWRRRGLAGVEEPEWGGDRHSRAACPPATLRLPLSGKSMLLSAIGKREVPIPEHIDIYHLTREMPPSDKTPLQCVMEVDTERAMLEREAERLAHEDGRAPDPGGGGGLPRRKGPGSLTAVRRPQRSARSSWSSTSVWRSWMPTRQRRGPRGSSTAWVSPLPCSARN